ncbi:hypothetical protein NHX12_029926 [Muraenolepis orangiensis]|uniref:NAD(+) ADP-ribosyltransferase n=1 Tax=Muraenolepis orangiensis TaxID=630683 RepID=A0A9Q0E6W5_9TELE|nr:hypothetical protein NHX12_029926 [Muraenolepis orangiensis]
MKGEDGRVFNLAGHSSAVDAVNEFKKLFKEKTENNWADRDNFVTQKGKFTLIELDRKTEVRVDVVDGTIRTVFVDPNNMPFGKLSERQIDKGFKVLKEIEETLANTSLEELSSRFYSTIPHDFGQNRPLVIENQEDIDQKKVYEDYDCMLNQTNIQDENKFYVIQVIKNGSSYHSGYSSANNAVMDFEKKFKDKTKNNWADRHTFKTQRGKFTLIELDRRTEVYEDYDCMLNQTNIQENMNKFYVIQDFEKKFKDQTNNNWAERDDFVTQRGKYTLIELDWKTEVDEVDGTIRNVLPVNLDIKKMPLGKLSKKQIDKGFKVLKEIEETLKKRKELSSKFYSTIPLIFGEILPPEIDNQEVIDQKKILLRTLL